VFKNQLWEFGDFQAKMKLRVINQIGDEDSWI